ncbi:MAG: PIN domain-containing protein [Solirubrobacterales bacterium]
MSPPAVLDTSVFIATEQGRAMTRSLPDEAGVSVVTLAELELGVLTAADTQTRSLRLATLTHLRELTAGLPADERVASAYARLAADVLAKGRKPRVHDTWIAATALVHGAEVWTQDADFTAFDQLEVVRV